MQQIRISFLFLIAIMFMACGNNTTTVVVHDISKIYIHNDITSIRSTDNAVNLSATVVYDDNTTADVSHSVTWRSSNTSVLKMTSNSALASGNGGDVNISILFEQFNDTLAFKVHKLTNITFSPSELNTTGQNIIGVKGTFDNNESNITMNTNIVWNSDLNATYVSSDEENITFDFHSYPARITAKVFEDDFNKTYTGN